MRRPTNVSPDLLRLDIGGVAKLVYALHCLADSHLWVCKAMQRPPGHVGSSPTVATNPKRDIGFAISQCQSGVY